MRVLLLSQLYPPVIGGEERHVRNLAVALAARGHDVHVATQESGLGTPTADPGVTVHLLDNVGRRAPGLYPVADRPLALPVPDPLTVRDLSRVVQEVRPDVVHAHNWIVNSYVALPVAYRLPLVLSLHDYGHVCATKRLVRNDQVCPGPSPRACWTCSADHYGPGRGQVIWGAVRSGLPVRRRAVDLFTPVSRYVALANGLDRDGSTYEVVPNFVPDALLDLPDAAADPALPTTPYLFFAGDLSNQKGLGTLLDAHALLDPTTRPALVLVGRAGEPLTDLAPDVHVHHDWAHERVLSGFRHALAAALPSEWPDPCPTTVLEAMALGAPLVTTHQGGIADMVVDGESALVVPPGSPPALAAALSRLIDDAPLRDRLRRGARVGVAGFTQSRVAEQLEGLYDALLSGTRSPAPPRWPTH